MKKAALLTFCFTVFYCAASYAQLQNTGWRRAGAIHLPNDWTNPHNASGSDDQYAEVVHQSGCRCPFMDLSWDDGVNFTSSVIFGPYDTTDSYRTNGDSTDNWGHAWTDDQLGDSAFVLRIWNSSTLLKQGYSHFSFGIPSGSSIAGIEVRVEAHGDSSYLTDFVDNIEARVYYLIPNAVNEIYLHDHAINIFPNPAHGLIHFRFAHDVGDQKIQLINLQGKVISENFFPATLEGNDYAMDIRSFSPGLYFVNIIGETKTVNARVAIQ